MQEVAEALAEAARTVPVLLVEQNLAVVRQLASSVTVLSGGRVALTGMDAGAFLDDTELNHRLLGVHTGIPADGMESAQAAPRKGA